jgi:hypothetical protein
METEVAWDEESTKQNTRLWRKGFVTLLGKRRCSVRPLEMTAECLGQCPAHAE